VLIRHPGQDFFQAFRSPREPLPLALQVSKLLALLAGSQCTAKAS